MDVLIHHPDGHSRLGHINNPTDLRLSALH